MKRLHVSISAVWKLKQGFKTTKTIPTNDPAQVVIANPRRVRPRDLRILYGMEPWTTNPTPLPLRGSLITTIPRSLATTTTLRTPLSQNPRMNTPPNLCVVKPCSQFPRVVHLLLPILVRSLRGRTFVNIPCGRERSRISSSKSPNIL